MPEIHEHRYDNGLVLVAEPVAGASSASVNLLTPAGLAAQPDGQEGVAPVLAEMVTRGAGGKGAREHAEALDRLGVQRSVSAGTHHLHLHASMLGRNLAEVMPLLVDMVRRPNLEEAALGPAKALAIQAIDGLADEPQQRAMIELREKHYPPPLGRSALGKREDIEGLTLDCVRAFCAKRCVGGGTILGVAGLFDWDALVEQVGDLLGVWSGRADVVEPGGDAAGGYTHQEAETTQVHIALAYDAPSATEAEADLQRAAAAVLSGGMSGRLFTEVREKRGLCYSVGVRYAAHKELGAVLGYAGTTTPRAQETLDVMVGELRRLSEGVDGSEFDRAMTGLKANVVMQGESTGARASAICSDLFVFGKAKTLEQRREELDAVDLASVNAFVAARPVDEMTLLTIGPEALRAPQALAAAE